MRRLKLVPEVNAGFMADIAFLLLIFFLITAAIPKDKGINRKLPSECPPGTPCDIDIHERNLLRVVINNNNEIMVDDSIVTISELKDITKNFIDNNGDGTCNYCNGMQSSEGSDHPKKAVISLQNDRHTRYNDYIKIQDELTKAIYEIRLVYSKKQFNKLPEDLSKEVLKIVKEAYPFMLSEAVTK